MGANILLVDDDPKVLEILSLSLERRGHRVSTAASGSSAIEQTTSSTPELIILDLALSDMTGYRVLEHVRDTHGDDPPVLFLSASTDVDAKLQALERGADDFLTKPVSLRELHSKVDGALRRSTRVRALGSSKQSLEAEIAKRREHASHMSKEFKRHLLSMRTLLTMSHDLNRALQSEDLIKMASLTLLGELKVSSMAMFALEHETDKEFTLLGVRGFDAKKFEDLTLDRGSEFVAMLVEGARPQQIARNPDQKWVKKLPDLRLAVFEYASPIAFKGEIKGVVFTGPKLSGARYLEYDLDIMMFIANSIALGMENSHLVTQLQTTYVSTLRSLISIIEAKDTYTKGHTERVASYAMAIANRLAFDEETLRTILFGALLHDIGKMGVLDEIIRKPGPLSEKEWELMRAHPVVGAQIVEKMEFLTGTIDIVRHHHESWNGKGYPDGLRGTDIPLLARIVTVADSFDAMTTDRPYRKALSLDEAVARLEDASGVQFDAELVRVFVKYVREKGRDLALVDASKTHPLDDV
jgi:putative nucleotidyltransferase with HDIG domain